MAGFRELGGEVQQSGLSSGHRWRFMIKAGVRPKLGSITLSYFGVYTMLFHARHDTVGS